MYLRKALPERTALPLWLFLEHELLKDQDRLHTYFLYVIWKKDHTYSGQGKRGFSQCCTWTSRPHRAWHRLNKGVHSWSGLWFPVSHRLLFPVVPPHPKEILLVEKQPGDRWQEHQEHLGSGYHEDCGGWFQQWHSSEWPRLCDTAARQGKQEVCGDFSLLPQAAGGAAGKCDCPLHILVGIDRI